MPQHDPLSYVTNPDDLGVNIGADGSEDATAEEDVEGMPTWLRAALKGGRLGETSKTRLSSGAIRTNGRREGTLQDEARRLGRVDALVERQQNATMRRVGVSVTELRKAAVALEKAEEVGQQARQERDERRRGVACGSALKVAQSQYEAARRERAQREWARQHEPTVAEQRRMDPFEREAYAPLVRLKEEVEKEVLEMREAAEKARKEGAEQRRKDEELRVEERKLEDALSHAEAAAAARRRSTMAASGASFRASEAAGSASLGFGAVPKEAMLHGGTKGKRLAAIWKRAANKAHGDLGKEKSQLHRVAEVVEKAAEKAREDAVAAAEAAEEAAEVAAEEAERARAGAQAHRGAKPSVSRAIKLAAWGARARKRVRQRHGKAVAAVAPTIPFVRRWNEGDEREPEEDEGRKSAIVATELELLLVRARGDKAGSAPPAAAPSAADSPSASPGKRARRRRRDGGGTTRRAGSPSRDGGTTRRSASPDRSPARRRRGGGGTTRRGGGSTTRRGGGDAGMAPEATPEGEGVISVAEYREQRRRNMMRDSTGAILRDEHGNAITNDVLHAGSGGPSFEEVMQMEQEKAAAAAAGGVGLSTDEVVQLAVDAAISGSWTEGLGNATRQAEMQKALGDPRARLVQEQSADGRNPSKAMLARRTRAPLRETRRRPPRGGALVRAAADGQTVDLLAGWWFQATDALVQLGRKEVPSRAAETKARARAFRIEQAAGLAHGQRSTSMEHGLMLEEDGRPLVAPNGGGGMGAGAVLCCNKERGGGGRQQGRRRQVRV